MSTKLGSKAAKHSAQGHGGKKGETPDPHTSRGGDASSPTASLMSEAGEGGSIAVHPLDAVLTGDEIQSLRITDEKLQKLRPSVESPASSHHLPPKHVMVRRTVSPADAQSRKKRVAVLHPMPPAGVGPQTTRTLQLGPQATRTIQLGPQATRTIQLGPQATRTIQLGPQTTRTLQLGQRGKRGDLSPHPVLGNIGERSTKQEEECLPPPTDTMAPTPHPSPRHAISYQDTIVPRETHALQYWEEAMEDRKLQQDYLSRKFRKSPERLSMNQGDSYRPKQEQRMQIDRAIPPLDYGKGYRVGSEFWSQSVPIGNAETGINTTLTRSEKGQPLPLELVGTPHTVGVEKGLVNAEKNATLCHTWQTTPYLLSRSQQLQSILTLTAPDITPDMEELEVIGHAPHPPPSVPHDSSLDSLGEEETYSEDSLSGNEDFAHPSNQMAPQDVVPETFPQSLEGPALKIRDHLLKWEGAPKPHVQTSQTRSEPVEFRLMFESGVEEEVTSCLPMENCGTTAIYYSWKRRVQPNPLQTVQAGDVQRFYFDTRGGVLLPGQVQSFPFVFKSTNAGIFTEVWALQTCPLLAGGQTIRVTLRGVAFREDLNKHKRDDLERELSHRVAVVAAERLVNQIINSIATPPHSSPQLLDTVPEEDVFRSQNPHLYYHYNVVLQLKALYDEILRPELTEDETPPPSVESGPSKKEKGKQAPAGGGGGGGKKEKEKERGESGRDNKKGKTVKTEPSEKVEIPRSPKPVEKPVPDWDLSTHTLLEVVLGTEEDQRREEKLKLLSDLLGELSFPPPSLPRISSYSLVYQLVSEAMEQVSVSSQRLCKVMGLPQRESCPTKSSLTTSDDDQLPGTTSSSAAVTNKKEKEKEKKGKKPDSKKAGSGKDKERAPSRGKGVAGRKSKTSVSSKDTDMVSEIPAEQTPAVQPVQQVDPLVEKKYRENLYASVYTILVATVEKMVLTLPEQEL